MIRKPWPIIILAVLYLTEPLFKLGFYSWYWDISVEQLFENVWTKSPYSIFIYFFSCPVAGIAIWAVRRWSVSAFLSIVGLTLIEHVRDRLHHPAHFSTSLTIALMVLNILVVVYFLVPSVRTAYLDPKIRWWEAHPRYDVHWNCIVQQDGVMNEAVVANFALGGVLLSLPEGSLLKLENPFHLKFVFENYSFHLLGKIRYEKHIEDKVRYGVQFQNVSRREFKNIAKCIKTLERRKFPRRPKRENPVKSFSIWAFALVTTGRGLFPKTERPAPTKESGPTKKAA